MSKARRCSYVHNVTKRTLFGLDVLELARRMVEVVCVGLGGNPTLIRLLNEELIPLLLCKPDGIFLGLEIDIGALHAVCRRLPAHQRVLPPVTSLQDVPVHSPVVTVPGSRLRSRL